METLFSQKIYRTHDNWGETSFADEQTMNEIIDDLHGLGDDWQDCSISDCTEYSLVQASGTHGLYRRIGCRHNEWIVFEQHEQPGYYRMINMVAMSGSRPAQYFHLAEIAEDFPELISRSGTAPNASIVLTDAELRMIEQRFGGSKSAAIHEALRRLAAE